MFAKPSVGEFRTQPLDAPFTVLPGDQALVSGSTITFIRSGVVVGTRTLTGIATTLATAATQSESINHAVFFWRPPVAGQSVVLISVSENATSGIITFKFSNGVSREFTDWPNVGSSLGLLDQQSTLAEDILAYKAFVNSPDGTNKTTMNDVNCTINFEASTPIALIGE